MFKKVDNLSSNKSMETSQELPFNSQSLEETGKKPPPQKLGGVFARARRLSFKEMERSPSPTGERMLAGDFTMD